ncbi:hypothetical protein J3R83DRAFT_8372 [Lanmaoa asiatica]|nr:hypothetical protein J3R83DRAFT_8372 [Lanmaoa asiatica]
MDPFSRPRDAPPQPPSITFALPAQDVSRYAPDPQPELDRSDPNIAFMKGPKRKRLAKVHLHLHLSPNIPLTFQKACDACHKSKRRCDGTGTLLQLGTSNHPHVSLVFSSTLQQLVSPSGLLTSLHSLRQSFQLFRFQEVHLHGRLGKTCPRSQAAHFR